MIFHRKEGIIILLRKDLLEIPGTCNNVLLGKVRAQKLENFWGQKFEYFQNFQNALKGDIPNFYIPRYPIHVLDNGKIVWQPNNPVTSKNLSTWIKIVEDNNLRLAEEAHYWLVCLYYIQKYGWSDFLMTGIIKDEYYHVLNSPHIVRKTWDYNKLDLASSCDYVIVGGITPDNRISGEYVLQAARRATPLIIFDDISAVG